MHHSELNGKKFMFNFYLENDHAKKIIKAENMITWTVLYATFETF